MIANARGDYSLIGRCSKEAVEQGLAAAEWYHTSITRKQLKALMRRKNGPALRDTLIWFLLLGGFAFGGYVFWGSWLCVPFFLCYGVLYASASDSRWHEAGHGTAFKTPWLNDALYQIASFMAMREPTLSRWSHARHHTDTIIVGRDREIISMRPPDAARLVINLVGLQDLANGVVGVVRHSLGRLTAAEASFIPEMENFRVYREARAWFLIYAAVIAAAIMLGSWLPVVYVLPLVYGSWLAYLLAITQHAGLAENVLDHRLNSRTIYMSRLIRFIYSNMNYHIEHHMFPMVPYHALPKLHEEVRHDMPDPYPSTFSALREILPTLWRQIRQPEYFIKRELPVSAKPFRPELHRAAFEV